MSQTRKSRGRGRGRPRSQVGVPPVPPVQVPPVPRVAAEVPPVPVEDISSQIDDIEPNASDGDENDTDTDVQEAEGGSLILQTPVRPVPRQPSASGSLLENSRSSSVSLSGQPSEPKFSGSDSSQGYQADWHKLLPQGSQVFLQVRLTFKGRHCSLTTIMRDCRENKLAALYVIRLSRGNRETLQE